MIKDLEKNISKYQNFNIHGLIKFQKIQVTSSQK